jgi:ArsR family transcriptional regulator
MASRTEALADIFKALSDPTRLRLIGLLAARQPVRRATDECGCGGLCVNALAQRLGLTQSAISQHLRILRHAGLVSGVRRGAFVHYALDRAALERCLRAVRDALSSGVSHR